MLLLIACGVRLRAELTASFPVLPQATKANAHWQVFWLTSFQTPSHPRPDGYRDRGQWHIAWKLWRSQQRELLPNLTQKRHHDIPFWSIQPIKKVV